jgi:hypothetical protein
VNLVSRHEDRPGGYEAERLGQSLDYAQRVDVAPVDIQLKIDHQGGNRDHRRAHADHGVRAQSGSDAPQLPIKPQKQARACRESHPHEDIGGVHLALFASFPAAEAREG